MASIKIVTGWEVLGLAREAHRGQTRRSGGPYIKHPINIAHTMMRHGYGSLYIASALLHDTIEDTYLNEKDLRSMIEQDDEGKMVVDAVVALTHLKEQGETYEDFITRVLEDPIAPDVKVFDIYDNTRPDELEDERDVDAYMKRLTKYLQALERLPQIYIVTGSFT